MRLASPIFIAGLDHSGKTVMRLAMEADGNLRLARHLDLWTVLRRRFAADASPAARRALVDGLMAGRAAESGLDRERLAGVATDQDFQSFATEIGRQLCASGGATRWGTQEALLEWELDAVFACFPEARVIQLIRDPRDRFATMVAHRAVGRSGLAGQTAAWVASARIGLRASAARPRSVMAVRYESLIEDPAAVLRSVCDFIGEPSNDALLTRGPLAGPTRRELRDAIGRGLKDLPWHQIAFVDRYAKTEMERLGYAPGPDGGPTGMLRHRIGDPWRWRLGRLAWWRRSRMLGTGLSKSVGGG